MSKAQKAKNDTDIAEAKEAAVLKVTEYIQEYMDERYVKSNTTVASQTTGAYVAAQMNGKTYGSYTFTTSGTALTVSKSGAEIVTGIIDGNGKIIWGGDIATKEWEFATEGDKDSSGTVTVGDLVQPTNASLASEKFYVIGKENGKVTLLAEKCVDTTNNEQSSSANTLAFDSTEPYSNVYAESTIKTFVDAYAEKFTGITIEEARLMLKAEAESLKTNNQNILYGTTLELDYWLGSPHEIYSDNAWYVYGFDEDVVWLNVDDDDYVCKLRPVFIVSESNF